MSILALQSRITEHLKLPFFFIAYELFILVQYTVTGGFFTTIAFYAVLAPAFLFYGMRHKEDIANITRQPLMRAYFIFFAYVMVHAIIVHNDATPFIKTINHVLALGVFLISTVLYFAYLSKKHITTFLNVLVVSVFVCAILSIILYHYRDKYIDLRLVPVGRASVQTIASCMYVMVAIISLYLYEITSWRRNKLFYLGVFFLIGYALLLIESRTSIFVYVLVGMIWGIVNAIRSKRFFVMSCILGAVAIYIALYDPAVHSVIAQQYERMNARGVSFRGELWREAMQKIAQRPWLGYGWNEDLPRPPGFQASNTPHPHNIYLATALYIGVPGAVLFYLIIFGSALQILKTSLAKNIFCLLAAVLLAHGLISGIVDHSRVIRNAGPFWIIFWLPIGMLMAVSLRDKLKIDD